jgi:hypothetical protein
MKQSGFALIESILLVFLAVVAIIAITLTWMNRTPDIVVPQKAKVIEKEIAKPVVTSTGKPPSPVKAYSAPVKKRVSKTYGLTIKGSEHVADAVDLPDDCGTAIVLYDDLTGEINTKLAPKPKPWLAMESSTELRLDVGYKGGKQVSRLSATRDLIQMKDFHFGATVAAYSDGDVFAGVGVAWRF